MRHQFDEPIGRQSGRTESAPEIYGHLWSGYLFNYPDGGSVHYDRHGDLIAFGCDGKKLRKFR
jgi:hypothetical protein